MFHALNHSVIWGDFKMGNYSEEGYISLEEAAKFLNIKPVTLRKWIKEKSDMPAHQLGRLWKFKRSELDEWVKSGKSAKTGLNL